MKVLLFPEGREVSDLLKMVEGSVTPTGLMAYFPVEGKEDVVSLKIYPIIEFPEHVATELMDIWRNNETN